jgi:pheromone shutdown protein TraB
MRQRGEEVDRRVPGSVTLIGTEHVSPSSLDEIKDTIALVQPDIVALELCGRRYSGDIPPVYLPKSQRASLRTRTTLSLLNRVEHRAGRETHVGPPETDMEVAVRHARRHGADLVLLDRDLFVTLDRFWSNASTVESLRLLWHLGTSAFGGQSALSPASDSTRPDAGSTATYLATARELFPAFHTAVLTERDNYMARRLNELRCAGYDVVAVVGAAHRPGIEAALDTALPNGPALPPFTPPGVTSS